MKMKYVRLKDGRIIVQGEPSDKGFKQGLFKVRNFGNVETLTPFSNDDILAESSSIEELCDEFVFEYYGGAMRRCYYSPNSETWVDCDSGCDLHHDFVETIKGGIWTDKGFIYAIEINEKGEWELL